jgi:hypothetical protein
VTSCVLEPLDAAATPSSTKSKPLTPSQKRALALLADVIGAAGEIPPPCDHIPTNTRCATEELWRGYCYAGQVSQSDKPDAKQKAFERSEAELLDAGRIGVWQEWRWIVAPDINPSIVT